MDAQEIAIAAVEVQNKQHDLFYSIESDNAALIALEDAKALAIINGEISGKNAEEREARAAQVLAEYIGKRRMTEAQVRHAKMMLDRAVMNWERVKYTIRLMESQP